MSDNDTGDTHDGDEDATDHCACDIELAEDEATSDTELPSTVGGIQVAHEAPDEDDNAHLDGDDVDFTLDEPTRDEELPVTSGGM